MTLEEKIRSIFPAPEEVPAEAVLSEPIAQTEYLVGGRLRAWEGPRETVLSPVCRPGAAGGAPEPVPIGEYPRLTAKEAEEALEAAAGAWDRGRGLWPTLPVAERIRHVEEFTHKMVERREEVVRLLMWEIGKSREDSAKEFDRTVEYIRDTINALKELDRVSSRFVVEEGILGQIRRSPLGVVLCMGPFNYPLNETFTTLIPALIMGNTVIFKPPKLGVLLHRPLLEAFRDSFPPGVINSVYGDGESVIGPLMKSGRIDVLAFIGSSRVADLLKHAHPKPHRLRAVLGLEAKNAGIVLPGADLGLAARECLLGALSYNGQRCTALKILFVHKRIAGEFLERFAAGIDGLPFGMPWEQGVKITPLPEPGKTDYLDGLVKDAEAGGARVMNRGGGARWGTYFHPALLYPVNEKMRAWREEQFGPVVPVVPFDSIEEPIRYVMESNYGQQVSLFGADPGEIARLIDPLVNQVCRVNINSQCQRGPDTFPFTGRKDSAEGTLSVSDALRVFTIRSLVAAKGTEENKEILRVITRERKSNFLSTDFLF
ncbi:MAG: NADP-dependent glyceraldehyde-3-phosphate dehydrogenase [Candidatus Eisenbacteria bacterium]|nr:NADP-dependent glyceraldehyde-3-phosphate dehydrogenase [Candidatus Eisenbacteria bacterium]